MLAMRLIEKLLHPYRRNPGFAIAVLPLAVVVLSMTAVLAGWIPARRAGRVPPMEALRDR